jgi:hypothetical protein
MIDTISTTFRIKARAMKQFSTRKLVAPVMVVLGGCLVGVSLFGWRFLPPTFTVAMGAVMTTQLWDARENH